MNSDAVRWCGQEENDKVKMHARQSLAGAAAFQKSCVKLVFLWLVISVNLLSVVVCEELVSNEPIGSGHYTPTWAVHIPGGENVANQIALDHGFINLGKVGANSFYIFEYLICLL